MPNAHSNKNANELIELQRQREDLIEAAAKNLHERIRHVSGTAAPTVADEMGRTALMKVVAYETAASLDTVRLLLACSDARATDNLGRTPLMHAVTSIRRDLPELVDLLLPLSDANARDGDGCTALMKAVIAGNAQIARALIAASAANAVDNCGWGALMHAARVDAAECVRMLLPVSDAKAVSTRPLSENVAVSLRSLSEMDFGVGWDALMIAAREGCIDCVELLLPHSDAKIRNGDGDTALMLAIRGSHPECADRLAEFSERREANAAMKEFGAAKMPRWSRRLAQIEADAIAQAVGFRAAGDTANGTLDATLEKPATPAPRARRI